MLQAATAEAAPVAVEATETATSTSEAREAADREALIAELDADEAPAERPGKSTKDDAAEDDGEAEAEETEGDADEETEETEEQAFATVDDFRDHLKELATTDIRKLETALGLEPGSFKVNAAKIRWVNTSLAKAEKATNEARAQAAEAESLKNSARQVYGPVVQAKLDFQGGTPQGILKAAKAVEGHFGVPLVKFVEAVVAAGKGQGFQGQFQQQDGGEIAELKNELASVKTLLTRQQTEAAEAGKRAQHVQAITGRIKGTELAVLGQAGAELVYAKLLASKDPRLGGYQLDLAGAIKATLEDDGVKWKIHQAKTKGKTGVPPKPANGNARPAPPVVTPTTPQRRRVPAPVKPKSREEAEAAEKAALIAELDKEEARAERNARRNARH